MELKKDTGMLCPATHETGQACPGCEQCASPDAAQAQTDDDVSYELIQNDELVASASGAGAWHEIQRYAAQYEPDGPVEIIKCVRTPAGANAAPVQAQPASDENPNWMGEVPGTFKAALAATQPAVAPAEPALTDSQIEILWAQHADTSEAGKRRLAFGRAVERAAFAARKPAADMADDARQDLKRKFIATITSATSLGERGVYGLAEMLLKSVEAAPSIPAQAGVPDRAAFEQQARYQGGTNFMPATNGACFNGWFPATYLDPATELAWRVWANKPSAKVHPVGVPEDVALRKSYTGGRFIRYVEAPIGMTIRFEDDSVFVEPAPAQSTQPADGKDGA